VAAQYRPMSVHILYKHLLEGQLSQCIHLLESSDVSGRFRPLSSIIWSWLRPVSGPSCNSFCLTFVHNTFTWTTSETLSHHLLAAVHWNAATCMLQCIGMQPPACCSALECSHLLAAVHWNAAISEPLIISYSRKYFVMVSKMVQELPCWHTPIHTPTPRHLQTDTVENSPHRYAVTVLMI